MKKTYVAFYKGRKTGRRPSDLAARFADWVIREITRSPYSHCEIAVKEHEQSYVYTCYSSSARDGGVRRKVMPLPPEKWDLVEVEVDDGRLRRAFELTKFHGYDWSGIFPFLPNLEVRWFCSEWCGMVLDAGRAAERAPAALAEYLHCLKNTSKKTS